MAASNTVRWYSVPQILFANSADTLANDLGTKNVSMTVIKPANNFGTVTLELRAQNTTLLQQAEVMLQKASLPKVVVKATFNNANDLRTMFKQFAASATSTAPTTVPSSTTPTSTASSTALTSTSEISHSTPSAPISKSLAPFKPFFDTIDGVEIFYVEVQQPHCELFLHGTHKQVDALRNKIALKFPANIWTNCTFEEVPVGDIRPNTIPITEIPNTDFKTTFLSLSSPTSIRIDNIELLQQQGKSCAQALSQPNLLCNQTLQAKGNETLVPIHFHSGPPLLPCSRVLWIGASWPVSNVVFILKSLGVISMTDVCFTSPSGNFILNDAAYPFLPQLIYFEMMPFRELKLPLHVHIFPSENYTTGTKSVPILDKMYFFKIAHEISKYSDVEMQMAKIFSNPPKIPQFLVTAPDNVISSTTFPIISTEPVQHIKTKSPENQDLSLAIPTGALDTTQNVSVSFIGTKSPNILCDVDIHVHVAQPEILKQNCALLKFQSGSNLIRKNTMIVLKYFNPDTSLWEEEPSEVCCNLDNPNEIVTPLAHFSRYVLPKIA